MNQKTVEEEISLVELVQILFKRWKLLIILPLLAAGIAYLVTTFVITPQYVSNATVIVMPFTEEAEGGGVIRHDVDSTQQVVKSCKELTMSHESMQRIIGELNLPYSAGSLQSNIEIDVSRDVTRISAASSDPERAYMIANHVTGLLMEHATETARLENVELLNPAQVPGSPDSPNLSLNIAVATVLGLMISIALAFLFEHLDNTIKSADDVQKYLGVPVLGVIPEIEEE